MNKFGLLFLSLALSGCVTYKIVPDPGFKKEEINNQAIEVKQSNEMPEGKNCFEPLLYVLTIGIVPTHCVNTYKVSNNTEELGTVKVTSMQGWVALILAPFPVWQYGYPPTAESEVKQKIESSK